MVLVVAILLISGMFLLSLQVPIALGLALTSAVFGMLFALRLKIDRIGILVAANFLLWLGTGHAVGGVRFSDFLSLAYLQGEGRIFISYLPLLAFCVLSVTRRQVGQVIVLTFWLGVGAVVIFLAWLLTGGRVFSIGPHFAGLLTSHVGAGSYFAFIAVFLCIYGFESHRPRFLIVGALALLPVLGATSRAAILGVFGALAWFALRRRAARAISGFLVLIALMIPLAPVLTPVAYERTAVLFSSNLVQRVFEVASRSGWTPGAERELEGAEGEVNALTRILLWRYAVDHFLKSPVLGIGFGRFNDYGLKYEGTSGVAFFATESLERRLTVATAHNSYLHVLAENGVIGLSLLLWLWWAMYARLGVMASDAGEDFDIRAAALAAQLLIVLTAVIAMFGHALAAPSICVPVLTLVGCLLAYRRSRQSAHRVAHGNQSGRVYFDVEGTRP